MGTKAKPDLSISGKIARMEAKVEHFMAKARHWEDRAKAEQAKLALYRADVRKALDAGGGEA